MEKIRILNCPIHNVTMLEMLQSYENGVLVTVNVDMMAKLQKDRKFFNSFTSADYCVNDSRIIYFCSKLLGKPLKATIAGSDFFPAFCRYHQNNENVKIFLLGAREGVAKRAMERINSSIGRQIIVGEYSPPIGFQDDKNECEKIIKIINDSSANVVAVGMGAPKQENWVAEYKANLRNIKQFMCIGATIDFEAGVIARAPRIFRNFGLEWFYRLIKEPSRLWKRYIVDDFPFFYLILKDRLCLYKNPFDGCGSNGK
jgi:exopolysaccharide biosynthesis WecB/TagA/CpsF family protein